MYMTLVASLLGMEMLLVSEDVKTSTSKYIAYILRHHPEAIGITLDSHGWAKVNELIDGVSKKYPIDINILEDIVRTDSKSRYSFNNDKTLIRANQGHSINVDVELEKREPPTVLYHGTATKYEESIDAEGLKSQNRLYVHLSKDIDTARNVGSRHGQPVIYEVNSKQMYEDGYEFFYSLNGVWLVKEVPAKYLHKII